jgi:hypothetical protein
VPSFSDNSLGIEFSRSGLQIRHVRVFCSVRGKMTSSPRVDFLYFDHSGVNNPPKWQHEIGVAFDLLTCTVGFPSCTYSILRSPPSQRCSFLPPTYEEAEEVETKSRIKTKMEGRGLDGLSTKPQRQGPRGGQPRGRPPIRRGGGASASAAVAVASATPPQRGRGAAAASAASAAKRIIAGAVLVIILPPLIDVVVTRSGAAVSAFTPRGVGVVAAAAATRRGQSTASRQRWQQCPVVVANHGEASSSSSLSPSSEPWISSRDPGSGGFSSSSSSGTPISTTQSSPQQRSPWPCNDGALLLPALAKPATGDSELSVMRRRFFQSSLTLLGGWAFTSPAAVALPGLTGSPGDDDAAATAAGLSSLGSADEGLAVTVRKSVVKGAQLMDQVDAQWEALSDKFHLGSERQKQMGRPMPKLIPPLKPLDSMVARQLVNLGDQVFVQQFPRRISPSEVTDQVRAVATTVAPAFARSLNMDASDLANAVVNDSITINSGDVFNFVSFCHYKAYSDLWLSRVEQQEAGPTSSTKAEYGTFKRQFETRLGLKILALLVPQPSSLSSLASSSSCPTTPRRMTDLFNAMVDKGLVASIDVSDPSDESGAKGTTDDCPNDNIGGVGITTFSVALDGDATLPSQLLLQEQGVRLYPNYARFALQALLTGGDDDATSDAKAGARSSTTKTTDVSIMDYYMDTDYNADPSKFQVKEVLMNVEIDRS